MGWSPKALQTRVASCFTIAVRLFDPTYRCGEMQNLRNAIEEMAHLEVDGNLDVEENGFAHLTHSVLHLAPGRPKVLKVSYLVAERESGVRTLLTLVIIGDKTEANL